MYDKVNALLNVEYMRNLLKKTFNVSDQLILTLWFFLLVLLFSNLFEPKDFVDYSLFYALQSIILLYVNSSIGQLFILEGKYFRLNSLLSKIFIHGVLVLVVSFIVLSLEIVKFNDSSIVNCVLISCLISFFCTLELLRKIYYSYNYYRQSLYTVLFLVGLNIVGFTIALFLDVLTFKSFLFISILSYLLTIFFSIKKLYSQVVINSKTISTQTMGYKYIYSFSKWLLLGTTAYIISSQLFIFYLNDYGSQEDVITYRLIQSFLGVVLVFVAAFENYYISSLKNKLRLKSVIRNIKNNWILFLVGLLIIMPFMNWIMQTFLNAPYRLNISLIMIIFAFYVMQIISRVFVIYLRLHKYNKTIFLSNFITSVIVIIMFVLGFELSITNIFTIKLFFPIINIVIYLIPYFKYEKKYFDNSCIRPR